MADTDSPAWGVLQVLKAVTGMTTGWDFHTGRLTATGPDKQVVLRRYGGRSSEPSIAIDYPAVQAIVRGSRGSVVGSYDEAEKKAITIKKALLGIPSKPAAYPDLDSVTMRGDINDLGFDDQDRPMFSLNFQLIVSYTESGYREAG